METDIEVGSSVAAESVVSEIEAKKITATERMMIQTDRLGYFFDASSAFGCERNAFLDAFFQLSLSALRGCRTAPTAPASE